MRLRAVGLLVIGCLLVACGGDNGAQAGSTTTTSRSGAAAVDDQARSGEFCRAVSELAADFGNLSDPTSEDVQRVQDRLTAIEANAPAEIADQIQVMIADYRSVVAAFVTYNFDSDRVLNEAGPQVGSVLERLATASRTGEVVEPELTVFMFVSEHCD